MGRHPDRPPVYPPRAVRAADSPGFSPPGFRPARASANGDSRRLLRYQFQVCSQNEEDGIIRDIFRRVGTTGRISSGSGSAAVKRTTRHSFSLKAGGDLDRGRRGPPRHPREERGLCNGRLKWLIPSISRENAAAIFERLGVAREIVLLSIDVDQNTSYIWEGLRGYRPRVVVIEYNPAIPPDVHWKVAYDPNGPWTRFTTTAPA